MKGVTSTALVPNYDFISTMVDLVNFKMPVTKDGVSYLPELLGEKGKHHKYVVYSSFMGPALITNDIWKIRYYAPKDIFQLYYLPNDYRKEKNILAENQEKAEYLKKY